MTALFRSIEGRHPHGSDGLRERMRWMEAERRWHPVPLPSPPYDPFPPARLPPDHASLLRRLADPFHHSLRHSRRMRFQGAVMSLSAHYIVSCRANGWFIGLEGERYGPFPDGSAGALIVAVQAANQAGKDGHDARVLLRAADGRVTTVWVFGTDIYPSPWVEDLHRTVQLPRRERARAPLPPALSLAMGAAMGAAGPDMTVLDPT